MNIKKNEMYVCPKCGEWESVIEDYEMDIDCLWVKLSCNKCEEEWSEYYTLLYDGCVYKGKTYDPDGKENTDI